MRIVCGTAILVVTVQILSTLLLCPTKGTAIAVTMPLLHTAFGHVINIASGILAECRCSFMRVDIVIRASVGIAERFVITARFPIVVMACVTITVDAIGCKFDDVAAATLERATLVFLSAAMLVVSVFAFFILAK